MYIYIYIYIYREREIYIDIDIDIDVDVDIDIDMYIDIDIAIDMHIYIYIYIYTHVRPGTSLSDITSRCIKGGVQWKQGVVIYVMLHTSLLSNTTPIHCTPCNKYPLLVKSLRHIHLRVVLYACLCVRIVYV